MLPLESFQRSSETSPAAITMCTPEHEILWANLAHANLFGYDPADLAGRNCIDFMDPNDREGFSRAIKDVLANPSRPVSWDSRVVCALGHYRWVQNTLCALPDVGFVLYQLDIDARRSADLEHERRAREFADSNARLQEFAYGAAHDLREPLRAIAACTELLARTAGLGGDCRQLTALITSGAARMSALIDDMLSFAMTGVQQQEVPVDLEAAVAHAAQHLAPEIAASATNLVVGRLPTVTGNEIHFVRIFQNLIGNAIKYRRKQAVTIEITAELEGDEWIVAVKDNGIGIAVEHQAEIFLPFKRLANTDVPGSGLGLALTKNMVERLGGAIWVRSKPGWGSTFFFSVWAASPGASRTKIQAA
jgi:PAS domain S-box-containing protein